MFDIGLGEIVVLGVIALLVFGPDQLPKVAAQAGKFVRQLRETATSARQELTEGTGLDGMTEDLKSLADLHPKRLLSSTLGDSSTVEDSATGKPVSNQPATPAIGGGTGGTAGGSTAKAYDPDAT